ncbi:MAG: hypothetical protein IT427_18730 [Pirellulales bacterium]|nr:hypothetical protein [Pirellulales bacterium]
MMNNVPALARREQLLTETKISTHVVGAIVAVLAAVAVARIAVWLQSAGFSTVVIFPLLVGGALGATIGFAATQFGKTSRGLALSGALLAGGVCAAAEHGFFYLDYRRGFEAKLQNDPTAQLAATANPRFIAPQSFSKFMATSAPDQWPLWTMDALAMIGSAGAAAWLAFANAHLPTARASIDPKTPAP